MKHLFIGISCMLYAVIGYGQNALKGTVKNEEGQPLVGAYVVLDDAFTGGTTDSKGVFHIKNVEPKTYTVTVSYIGYESMEQKVAINGIETIDFVLKPLDYLAEEVIVLGTRATYKTPTTFTELSKKEIEVNNLGQDIPYLLQFTPSAVVTSDAGTGIGYTGIRIRGTDPTRINVTINGIPLNDAESQGVFWVNLPDFASSLNNVQIQRGVGTSTNGAAAFGATINLLTAERRAEPFLELNNTFGSFNTLKNTIVAGTGLIGNRLTLEGRYSRINSDGYIDRGSADLDSYYFSAAYYGRNSTLTFNAFHGEEVTYQAWNGVPGYLLDSLRTFNSAGTESDPPYENEVDDYQQTHYQLLYAQNWSNYTLNLAAHYTKGAGFFEQYKAEEDPEYYNLYQSNFLPTSIATTDLVRRRWLDNDFYGMTYDITRQTDNLQFTLGGAWNYYDGDHFGEVIFAEEVEDNNALADARLRYYDGFGIKTDFNVFTKVNYQANEKINLFVDLQYRNVGHEIEGIDNDKRVLDQTVNFNFFNPKAGVTYTVNPNSNFYFSYAMANREPSRGDLTDAPENLRPRPETLHDFELGHRWKMKKAYINTNAYYMAYQDQLVLTGQINDVGGAIRTNVDESYRLGLEIEAGVKLTDNLIWRANATLSQNKILNFTEYVDDWDNGGQITINHGTTDIAFSPNVVFNSELAYQIFKGWNKVNDNHQLEAALLSKYVGKQYFDNTSLETSALDAYFVNDFRLTYTYNRKWLRNFRINIMVRNLFNELYESNAWIYRYSFDNTVQQFDGFYPQAGRNFLIGVDFHF